jgi:hypothetical protein
MTEEESELRNLNFLSQKYVEIFKDIQFLVRIAPFYSHNMREISNLTKIIFQKYELEEAAILGSIHRMKMEKNKYNDSNIS